MNKLYAEYDMTLTLKDKITGDVDDTSFVIVVDGTFDEYPDDDSGYGGADLIDYSWKIVDAETNRVTPSDYSYEFLVQKNDILLYNSRTKVYYNCTSRAELDDYIYNDLEERGLSYV